MAGAAQAVELGGLAQALSRIGAMPRDFGPALRSIAVYLRSVSLTAFARSTDPATNAPWAPLKAASRRKRRGGGKGARILVDTGLLRSSVTAQPSGAASLVWGSNVYYAGFHQWGGKRLPRRSFIGLSR